jgi:hypothetical protein
MSTRPGKDTPMTPHSIPAPIGTAFAQCFADPLLALQLAPLLTCREADTFADLLSNLGHGEAAQAWRDHHADVDALDACHHPRPDNDALETMKHRAHTVFSAASKLIASLCCVLVARQLRLTCPAAAVVVFDTSKDMSTPLYWCDAQGREHEFPADVYDQIALHVADLDETNQRVWRPLSDPVTEPAGRFALRLDDALSAFPPQ